MLAAFDFELGVLEQRPPGDLDRRRRPVSATTRPGRSGVAKEKRRLRLSRCSALAPSRLILSICLSRDCACLRLGRLVAEALDESLHPLDLRLLALDRLAEGDLARRLLLAPGVPGPGEEAGALRLQLQHRGADRLEEPAVVGDEDDGGVEVDAGSAPATRARGCRGGSSARRAAAGRGGWRAPGRARRGSARRRRRSRAGARSSSSPKPRPRRTASTSSRQR